MCRMKEKGMTEQERSEAWDKLDCLMTKHGLQEKFEEWGLMYGMAHALHNVKDTVINLGEVSVAKFFDGIIQEVLDAQAGGCGEGCECAHGQEETRGCGCYEAHTAVEEAKVESQDEVVPPGVIQFGDGSEYRPIMPQR